MSGDVVFGFSDGSADALSLFCWGPDRAELMSSGRHIDPYSVSAALASDMASARSRLSEVPFLIAKSPPSVRDKNEFAAFCTLIGRLMGELVIQNAEGAYLIEVYDRNMGRIEDGVRYHQTRQNGEIHTDSVNHPIPFSHLLLGCTAPSTIGGESILVLASQISSALERFPDIAATLQEAFWFEGRGMSADVGHFRAPVMFEWNGKTHFRYLRGYIEAAHRNVGEPMTSKQVAAFDALDALLEVSANQYRVSLCQGEILITMDTQVFHGRTSFFDSGSGSGWSSARHMFRLWVKEPGSHSPEQTAGGLRQ